MCPTFWMENASNELRVVGRLEDNLDVSLQKAWLHKVPRLVGEGFGAFLFKAGAADAGDGQGDVIVIGQEEGLHCRAVSNMLNEGLDGLTAVLIHQSHGRLHGVLDVTNMLRWWRRCRPFALASVLGGILQLLEPLELRRLDAGITLHSHQTLLDQ